ncbi:MFS transporter [Streptomyces sp. NPDC014870]|uniref:MFS transporter n=1 Tax=Streptomyces sp. NPDC014870 TaxID=3364925 RepID=UPI0037014FF9
MANTDSVVQQASRAPRALLLAQLSNAIGDGAFYVTSALYFSQIVGLSAARIGIGLTLAWAVGSVAGVWLGHLADRRGPRTTAVLLALATAAAVGSFLLIRSFVPFLVAAAVYATAQSGLALHAGTRTAYLSVFALDAAGFLVCALLLRGLPAVAPAPATAVGEPRLAVLRDRPYALLTLLNALMLLRLPLLSLAVPLWIVQRTSAPGWIVSALFVLNTGVVMLFQVRTARKVTGLREATRAVGRAGVVMLASCAVFAVTAAGLGPWTTVAVLVLGAALQVVAEMRHSAGSWQIGFALAPAGRIGQYQGFYGTGVPVARTLGPFLVTALLVTWGAPGWLVLGGIFLLTAAVTGPAVRWAERARTQAPAARDSGEPVGAR